MVFKTQHTKIYMIILIIGLLFSGLSSYSNVLAQSTRVPYFESVSVTLYPEYDQPSVLVTLAISLPDLSFSDKDVILKLPQGVHDIESLTEIVDHQELRSREYKIVIQGGDSELHFKPHSKEFQVKFYDANLVKNETLRSYTYKWNSVSLVRNFYLKIIRPVGASEVEIMPELSVNVIGSDGIEYYEETFGRIRAGEDFILDLSYVKELGDLSNSALDVVPGDPIDTFTAGQTPKANSLMLALLSIVSAGMLGILVYLSLRFTSDRKKKISDSVLPADEQKSSIYCLECGQRLEKRDRFCRSCGVVLR